MVSPGATYASLTGEVRKMLHDAGNENAAFEARQLAAFCKGDTTEGLLRDYALCPPEDYREKLMELVMRRLSDEPLAYILGFWEFYGLRFNVSPAVLIPRIDTETAVYEALGALKGISSPRIMDLCTGSGCIGLTLLHNIPDAAAVLADISDDALSTAKANAEALGLSDRAEIIKLDALSPFPETLRDFDLIISNPPYIPTAEVGTLDLSVRGFEPRSALDGGEDGLDFYRAIVPMHMCRLRKGGLFIFEIGEGQAEDVCSILSENGFADVKAVKDTAGTDRVILGRRNTCE